VPALWTLAASGRGSEHCGKVLQLALCALWGYSDPVCAGLRPRGSLAEASRRAAQVQVGHVMIEKRRPALLDSFFQARPPAAPTSWQFCTLLQRGSRVSDGKR